jgi:hypothetical protein
LYVPVLEVKTTRVAFYYVQDRTGRRPGKLSPGAEDAWLKTMNRVYLPQVGRRFVKEKAAWVTIARDLGPVVTLRARDVQAFWDLFIDAGQGDKADFHVYLLWEFQAESSLYPGDYDAAVNWHNDLREPGRHCVCEEKVTRGDIGLSLAHEAGHHLLGSGHNTQEGALMYRDPSASGSTILYDEAVKMRR